MSDTFEPGGSGAGTLVAQGAIVVFLLLLLALFVRTAFMMSTLFWVPVARLFGKGRDPASADSAQAGTKPSAEALASDGTQARLDGE